MNQKEIGKKSEMKKEIYFNIKTVLHVYFKQNVTHYSSLTDAHHPNQKVKCRLTRRPLVSTSGNSL